MRSAAATRVELAIAVIAVVLAVGIWFSDRAQPNIKTSFADAGIDWNDVHQPIDGFGGSSADFLTSLTSTQADFFFTTNGIGLSILRTQIIPDRDTCNVQFHQNGCSESNGQILNGELETAKLAVARGAIVFSTPWSPRSAYKSNGSFTNGGSLLPSHYSDWARDVANYVVMMKDNGVPIYAVSVQNEPNVAMSWGSCRYTAQELHDFVPYLYAALHSAGAGATKIMIGEQSSWAFDLTSDALADPIVASEVGIIAAHGYLSKAQPHPIRNTRLWQTEDCSQSPTYNGSMWDAMGWAAKIHEYLTVANVNAWMWWFLTDMPNQGEGTDNGALTGISGNYPKRAYVTGQWSKFVRPGWSRIGVNYSGPLLISAFKEPGSQSFAIVCVNPSTKQILQKFFLNGSSATSVIPWISSQDLSLSVQPAVAVNGDSFTYKIPAYSVTTFAGTASLLRSNR